MRRMCISLTAAAGNRWLLLQMPQEPLLSGVSLSEALAAFSPEVVLRISYFEEDEDYLRQLVREAYLSDPTSALGMPEAQIAMYPGSGPRRIVEILLTYPKPREILESQRNSLRREAERLVSPSVGLEEERKLEQLSRLVGNYDPGGGSTAYDALLGSGANSQGLALSFSLLCTHAELNCMVVDGRLNGEIHQWNVVETIDGWRHVDLTREEDLRFWTDEEPVWCGICLAERPGSSVRRETLIRPRIQ